MSEPDPQAEPARRVWLVNVTERSDYLVKIDEAVLGLAPGTPEHQVTEHLRQAADLMVGNGHPEAIRVDTERTATTIEPLHTT